MTTDEKLSAILAAVQTDPGNRGLARDPHDNLFTATAGDFQAACRSIAKGPFSLLGVVTGFFIPGGAPPAFETDGPLGAVFFAEAIEHLEIGRVMVFAEGRCLPSLRAGFEAVGLTTEWEDESIRCLADWTTEVSICGQNRRPKFSHLVSIERAGPSTDGRCRSMKARDITEEMAPAQRAFQSPLREALANCTIGIGDGGNEIGMGKIPHETIVKNIPNGDLIHCRVPTDHLIVCGVSNWGAYALAAGVYVLRGVKPPADLFDPDREREILEVMVREGPLVDGVTGKQTATVDGLTWDEYVKPLIRIREILES
ncbi:MAG: DUF4392 domain-containing protein [Gemmataceae bacterium]